MSWNTYEIIQQIRVQKARPIHAQDISRLRPSLTSNRRVIVDGEGGAKKGKLFGMREGSWRLGASTIFASGTVLLLALLVATDACDGNGYVRAVSLT